MLYETRQPSKIMAAVGLFLAAGLLSCQPEGPTEPVVTGIALAKGGAPAVDEAIPPGAPQGTTLDVRVLGSGFDDGSEATFTIDGVPQEKVRTNHTQFVSKNELRANLTIEVVATIELYDVEVVTTRGKKGIGADLFKVVEAGTALYTVTDLGGAPKGGGSGAIDIDEAGEYVVGSSHDGRNYWPTIWNLKTGEIESLDVPVGYPNAGFRAINPAAATPRARIIAVGTAEPDGWTSEPVRWDRSTGGAWQVSFLDRFGFMNGAASDVNDSGIAVGWVGEDSRTARAIAWDDNGNGTFLPPLDHGDHPFFAYAVNNAGHVVGRSHLNEDVHAVLWLQVGGEYTICDLHSIAGDQASRSVAYALSELADGVAKVLGHRWLSDGQAEMTVWTVEFTQPDACPVEVTPQYLASADHHPHDINRFGEAVGHDLETPPGGVMWTREGQEVALPALKANSTQTNAINDRGQIVGSSTAHKNERHAVVWNLVK